MKKIPVNITIGTDAKIAGTLTIKINKRRIINDDKGGKVTSDFA